MGYWRHDPENPGLRRLGGLSNPGCGTCELDGPAGRQSSACYFSRGARRGNRLRCPGRVLLRRSCLVGQEQDARAAGRFAFGGMGRMGRMGSMGNPEWGAQSLGPGAQSLGLLAAVAEAGRGRWGRGLRSLGPGAVAGAGRGRWGRGRGRLGQGRGRWGRARGTVAWAEARSLGRGAVARLLSLIPLLPCLP